MKDVPQELGQQILAAAESYGTSFDDVTMDEIAVATGVPRATLYYHFRSKEQVLAFLLTSMLGDIATSVEAAAATGEDTRTRLSNVVRAQLGAMRRLATEQLRSPPGRAGKLLAIAAPWTRVPGTRAQDLARRCDSGEIRPVVPTRRQPPSGAVTIVGLHALMLHGHLMLTAQRLGRRGLADRRHVSSTSAHSPVRCGATPRTASVPLCWAVAV
jgi:AcrR family transcriptional regulator